MSFNNRVFKKGHLVEPPNTKWVSSKRDSLTVKAFACYAAGPGSNLEEDKNLHSFFGLRGCRVRNDCGKIERIYRQQKVIRQKVKDKLLIIAVTAQ